MKNNELCIKNAEELMFGRAPKPVTTKRGMVIGGGQVYSELNFTLPTMIIEDKTIPEIQRQYTELVEDALARAVDLDSQGVILEFETLPEMTLKPEIAIDIVKRMNDVCEKFFVEKGLQSEIRLTPNDTREFDRPPLMRSGKHMESILKVFEEGGKAGGDLFSIESTGGKEIHDDALTMGDIQTVMFAQSVLGTRDMNFLWEKIVTSARNVGCIAGGDTACGFANTAMVLADRNYIPKIFAAIVRIISIVRTLPAYEQGAVGPDKDCGYEGPFIKAITGIPISMEGKTSACAHLSPLGNVASAAADLWSNESIQNIKLLGGMAPTVYLEQLEYDVRLLNQALTTGNELMLQKLLVDSDIYRDPQAFILSPANVITISDAIIGGVNYVDMAKRGALTGLSLIEESVKEGRLVINEREVSWIDMLRMQLEEIPNNESAFIDMMSPRIDKEKVNLAEYGIIL